MGEPAVCLGSKLPGVILRLGPALRGEGRLRKTNPRQGSGERPETLPSGAGLPIA